MRIVSIFLNYFKITAELLKMTVVCVSNNIYLLSHYRHNINYYTYVLFFDIFI